MYLCISKWLNIYSFINCLIVDGMALYYTKEELEEMLEVGEADFRKWRETKKVAYLRDASNKLIAIAENLTAYKTGKKILNWGDFRSSFLKEFKDRRLMDYLYDLHRFFYEGRSYDERIVDIEYKYHITHKELRSLIKHSKLHVVAVGQFTARNLSSAKLALS